MSDAGSHNTYGWCGYLRFERQKSSLSRSTVGQWAVGASWRTSGREFFEETGFQIEIISLIGIFSSLLYSQSTNVNRGKEVVHLLFAGRLKSGKQTPSEETPEIGWFSEDTLPRFSDGHEPRVKFGFEWFRNPAMQAHFE